MMYRARTSRKMASCATSVTKMVGLTTSANVAPALRSATSRGEWAYRLTVPAGYCYLVIEPDIHAERFMRHLLLLGLILSLGACANRAPPPLDPPPPWGQPDAPAASEVPCPSGTGERPDGREDAPGDSRPIECPGPGPTR